VQSVLLGVAQALAGRPQLVLAVPLLGQELSVAEELFAAQGWGFEPVVAAVWPPGRASAPRPAQEAIRACLHEA
jgi:hypothetical protein